MAREQGGPGLPAASAPWSSGQARLEEMLTEEEIWQVILFMYEATGQVPRTWNDYASFETARPVCGRHGLRPGGGGCRASPSTGRGRGGHRARQGHIRQQCAHCHGAGGGGTAPGPSVEPRPRDFTRGLYKIRSTESRELPTDADLLRIVTDGMRGTSMPGWPGLSDEERLAVVAYIKTFAKHFERATAPPLEIALVDRVPPSEESVSEGRRVFEMLECAKCHGQQGRGDGPSALTLLDEWNYPTRPADLTMSWRFRGGDTEEDLYRRFMGGLAGTPMPSIKESFPMDMEVEDIQIMIEDEEEISAENGRGYDDAMRDIRVKTWHLANYVRSLSPAQKPEVAIVLESALVEGELPQRADDPRWGEGEGAMFPLAGQVIIEPRLFGADRDSRVRQVHAQRGGGGASRDLARPLAEHRHSRRGK